MHNFQWSCHWIFLWFKPWSLFSFLVDNACIKCWLVSWSGEFLWLFLFCLILQGYQNECDPCWTHLPHLEGGGWMSVGLLFPKLPSCTKTHQLAFNIYSLPIVVSHSQLSSSFPRQYFHFQFLLTHICFLKFLQL